MASARLQTYWIRNEFREQMELRRRFEPQLKASMEKAFHLMGERAAAEIKSGSNLNYIGFQFIEDVKKALDDDYRNVINAFAARAITLKEESEFENLVQLYISTIGVLRVTQISDTTLRIIRKIIADKTKEGLSLSAIASAIEDSMNGSFSKYRAATIARTETHSASTFANHEATKSLELPNQRKIWLATNDARTREAHRLVNGTEIGIDDNFLVGGVPMAYPGDPAGGAANVVNCRCVTLYVSDV